MLAKKMGSPASETVTAEREVLRSCSLGRAEEREGKEHKYACLELLYQCGLGFFLPRPTAFYHIIHLARGKEACVDSAREALMGFSPVRLPGSPLARLCAIA